MKTIVTVLKELSLIADSAELLVVTYRTVDGRNHTIVGSKNGVDPRSVKKKREYPLCPRCKKHRIIHKTRSVCSHCYYKGKNHCLVIGREVYRKKLYNEDSVFNNLELRIMTVMVKKSLVGRWSSKELSKATSINNEQCRAVIKRLRNKGVVRSNRKRFVLTTPNKWGKKYVVCLQHKGLLEEKWVGEGL